MEYALPLESMNQSLLKLYKLAIDKYNPYLCDFIEAHYLIEQVKSIKELRNHKNSLCKMAAQESGMAECFFDQPTQGDSDDDS